MARKIYCEFCGNEITSVNGMCCGEIHGGTESKNAKSDEPRRRTGPKFQLVFLIALLAQSCAMTSQEKARWGNAFQRMNESGAWDAKPKKKPCVQQSVVYVNGQYHNVQTRNLDCE